ncbi:MAG: hypothetical protein KC431_03350, partial [Myxococcales bacterium]|nr:hypothetical protein [Myxococcales bacterium]
MFGTLKPAQLALDCRSRGRWQRFYCGTCQSLGAQFGLAYRGLLSHDAVFLAMLVDGLQARPGAEDRCRCPMLPVVHRPTIGPDAVAMRYAAAVQMLLADQWLADRAIDGRSLHRWARPLLAQPAAAARETLRTLGSDLGALEGFEWRQAAVEAEKVGSTAGRAEPEQAAEPTAAALELVFSHIAALPGSAARTDDAITADDPAIWLARLGRAVGRSIYLIDALEDLEDDLRRDAFNPCLTHDFRGRPTIDPGRLRRAIASLEEAGAELSRALAALPLLRHRELLDNVLITAMGERARQAIARARAALGKDRSLRATLLRLLRAAPFLRTSQALAAMAVTLFTVFWPKLAAAAPAAGKRKKAKKLRAEAGESTTESDSTDTDTDTDTDTTDTGTTDTGTGTDTDTGLPDLDPPIDDPGSSGGGGFGDCLSPCCGGLSDLLSSCGGCGSSCAGCIDECNNSCSGCGSACENCGDCGNACDGCGSGCGDCSNACNGCGQGCGQGCGDCGNACNG